MHEQLLCMQDFGEMGSKADLIIHVSQLSRQPRPAAYARSPHLALSHLHAGSRQ